MNFEVFHGHYDRSQRELDAAIERLLNSPEYTNAHQSWRKRDGN